MELVSEAITFAVKVHDGMRRKKSEIPYIMHPLEAAVIVSSMTDDQYLIAAAVLHDVVEDTGITINEIFDKYGEAYFRNLESNLCKELELPIYDQGRETFILIRNGAYIEDNLSLHLPIFTISCHVPAGMNTASPLYNCFLSVKQFLSLPVNKSAHPPSTRIY